MAADVPGEEAVALLLVEVVVAVAGLSVRRVAAQARPAALATRTAERPKDGLAEGGAVAARHQVVQDGVDCGADKVQDACNNVQ